MALAAGERLGPYEIAELLGAGGMAEVYRAHDPRLARDVAIKVVLTDGGLAPDRLRRFEDEARAVAALSHPNVLTVFDVGAREGCPYLVVELLEGESLRQRLERGAMPLRSAIELAIEVCHGLEAAHARSVVHCDLKPDNLFLTADGRVKILDFGIARLTRPNGRDPADTDTQPGLVMGTVGYVSPEQARGLAPDGRADIFALGAILYEALSGRRAFAGASAADTIAAVLHDDPAPLRAAIGPVPSMLDRVVRRCLHKDRDERFHSAHDLALALEAVLDRPVPGSGSAGGDDESSPYPGLRAFTEADAGRFFGREAEVRRVWERLRHERLLGVVGPSGAGKTSFVRAGVAAAVPTGWAVVVCTPGAAPFPQLGQALAPHLVGDAEALRLLVRFDDPESALALLARWRRGYVATVVIVDQFEELFTLNPPECQARFAALLGRLAAGADVRVVLSMRDDFLMRCHDHEGLRAVFDGIVPIGAPSGQALRRALVEPARAEGFRFEEGLADEMLAAVEGERGALPLLAFSVARVWSARDRGTRLLARAAYEQTGGVAGALAQHAEEILERIGDARQALVREIFRNLVSAEGTRASADREELLSAFADRGAAEQVLDELVDARLLTAYEARARDGERRYRVEVIHESLLRAWPRLERWQAQDTEGALLRDQLKQAAHLWHEKGRPADLLWSGTSFREFALWRERYPGALTALEEQFGRAMASRAERRSRLRALGVAGVFAALLIVLAVIGLLLRRTNLALDRSVADEARARASKLVALGRLELERYPTAALAYARKSLEISDTIEGRLLALEALWRGPTARVLSLPPDLDCIRLAFSPDARGLACAGFQPNVALFTADGTLRTVLGGHDTMADTRGVAFGPGGDEVLTWAPGDPRVRRWSTDGREVASFAGDALWLRLGDDGRAVAISSPGAGGPHRIRSFSLDLGNARSTPWEAPPGLRLDQPGLRPLAVDGEARWVIYGKGTGIFRHRLDGRAPDLRLGSHPARVRDLRLDPAESRLLSVDERGGFRLWSLSDGRLLRTLDGAPPQRFTLPSFDRTGVHVAWAAQDGTHVWDLADAPDALPLRLARGDIGDFGETAFSRDGRWLATGNYGSATFFPLGLPHARTLRGHLEAPAEFAFTPDSRRLVSCAKDGARSWPLVPGAAAGGRLELEGDYYCYGVAADPRGEALVVVSPFLGAYLVPGEGGPPRKLLDFAHRRIAVGAVAFDPRRRRLAVASHYADTREEMLLYVLDLESGATETVRLREPGGRDPWAAGVRVLRFDGEGRVLAGGDGGIRRWRPGAGLEAIVAAPGASVVFDASVDGRTLVVVQGGFNLGSATLTDAEVFVLDLVTGARRRIATHGRTLSRRVATDPRGRVLVTGDPRGVVRVGLTTGEEPHLLLGHDGPVRALAVSPDARWIASASGNDVRLWPMPDLSRPPLHTLPHDELMAKLHALTNLQVVEDATAPTGYKLEVGPFPGWQDVPTW